MVLGLKAQDSPFEGGRDKLTSRTWCRTSDRAAVQYKYVEGSWVIGSLERKLRELGKYANKKGFLGWTSPMIDLHVLQAA